MEKAGKKKWRRDLLLIAALLLLAGALLLWQRHSRSEGRQAVVYVNGERIGAYPLSKDVRIRLGDGESYNVLVIENGAADMTDASCPDRICVNMHPIRYVGETITCLPHKTMIRIEGEGEAEVDIP